MSIAKKGSVFFITFFITSVFNVIAVKVYTSYLSLDQYGVYSYLQGIFMLLTAFNSKWVMQSIFRFKNEYDTGGKAKLLNGAIALILCLSSVLLIPTIYIIQRVTGNLYVAENLWPLWVVAVSTIAVEIVDSWVQSSMKSKNYAIGELSRSFLRLIMPFIVMSLFGKTIAFFLLGFGFANLSVLFIQILFLKPSFEFNSTIFGAVIKTLWLYGYPITLWYLCTQFMNYVDRFILEHYWSIDKVGLYSANSTIFTFAAQLISLPLINTFHPMLLRFNVDIEAERASFEKLLNKVTNYYVLCVFFICGVLVIFKELITHILLSQKYQLDSFTIYLIVFGTALWNLGSYGNKPFEIKRKTILMLKAVLFCVPCFCILSIWLIPTLSYRGAALAKFVSYALYPFILLIINKLNNKKVDCKIEWNLPIYKILILIMIPLALSTAFNYVFKSAGLNAFLDFLVRGVSCLALLGFIITVMADRDDVLFVRNKVVSLIKGASVKTSSNIDN